ncbi:Major facilitator superfamily,Major facilitator superfamily domain [Cinara cedri]|uniref:Major facilitator superfamily,Major facilitator superfamily domain n=1 Tax=Cinara cedri TaxID=506608 RepID=A0A5E4M0R4_9HEMI|nr:Major facilitator superfamily,Major facilitator superfamily domain [Cinara cedri]
MTKAQLITQNPREPCKPPVCVNHHHDRHKNHNNNNNNSRNNGSVGGASRKISAAQMMKKGTGGSLAIIVPPDGGWGWVVVFAAFYCNVVVDGIIFSFGMLINDMVNTFHETESKISIVGSLLNGFYLIAGPFVSALLNSVDFRSITIIGSIISSIAFLTAAYLNSVYQLMFFYGLIGGIGFSMVYVSAVLIPGFYFDKWRALATGISVCGSGIGTFVLAPLNAYLVEHHGWRIALMVQAGLALSCGAVGILFRPLKPTIVEVPTANPVVMEPKTPEDEPLLTNAANGASGPRKMSLDSNKRNSVKAGAPTAEEIYNHLSDRRATPEPRGGISMSCHSLNTHNQYLNDRLSPDAAEKKLSAVSLRRPSLSAHLMDRDDRFFGGSLTRLPQYSSQVSSLNYAMSVTRIPAWNELDENDEETAAKSNAFQKNIKKYYKTAMHTLTTMLDFSILSSPSFFILSCSGFFTLMGFFVPFIYISEKAVSMGMEKNMAVWLVSTIGITNTLGRVICGWISSYDSVDPIMVNNVSLTFGGMYTVILPLLPYSVFSYYLYASLFGLSMACFASLRSTLIVELTGLELLTNAFGVLLMFQGVAAALGSPLLGMFKDWTGTYDVSFYLSGVLLITSAVICYPLRRVKKWEDGRKSARCNGGV